MTKTAQVEETAAVENIGLSSKEYLERAGDEIGFSTLREWEKEMI